MQTRLVVANSIALGILATAWGTAAAEEEPPEEERTFASLGGYVLAGGFYGVENYSDKSSFQGGGPVDVDDGAGFDFRAGIRAHAHAAVEIHFQWFSFDVDSPTQGDGEMEGWVLTVNAKGYLLTGRIQPYVVAGLGFLEGDGKGFLRGADDDFALRMGGGIDLYATPMWAVSCEASYVLPTGDVSDLDYLSIGAGVMLRF